MKITKVHINAIVITLATFITSSVAAYMGESCLSGNILAAGLAIAAIFARENED